MHLSYDDFCRMTFEEFGSVYTAYITQRDFDYKDKWERMRMQSTIYVNMHVARGKTINPEDLLKFAWDEKKEEKKKTKRTTKEQHEITKRLMRLVCEEKAEK